MEEPWQMPKQQLLPTLGGLPSDAKLDGSLLMEGTAQTLTLPNVKILRELPPARLAEELKHL